MKNNTAKAVFCAALGNILWGFSFLFIKQALSVVSEPNIMLAHRFTLSVFIMLLMMLFGKAKISLKGKNFAFILLLLVFQICYYVFESYALLYTNSTIAGLGLAVVPVVTIGTGALFLKEYPSLRQALFCIMPVVGVVFITLSGKELGVMTPLGGLFLLITVVASALFKTANRKASQEFTAFERTFFVLASSSVVFTVAGLKSANWNVASFVSPLANPKYIISVLFLAILCSIAANILVNYATSQMSVFKVSSYGALSTLCSAVAGIALLGEPVNLGLILGGVLIIVGVREVTKPKKEKKLMYDILIKNGMIIDGTGSPSMRAQVAVKDGKIVKIARNIDAEAKAVIDAAGKVVTPGFIDSHSHSDKQFFSCPEQKEKVEQGITTSVAGQCGGSICSTDAAEFLDNARGCKLGANIGQLIGHGALRKAVVGNIDREPTAEELEKMKNAMREAMEHGALGVSFGLIYAPGCFAKTQEAIEIAKVVGEYHGIAAIHLRNEGAQVVEAVNEFVTIVKEAGVRGVISHHKSAGNSKCWGKVRTTLEIIDKVNEEGYELYADVYPYIASHTKFSSSIIPISWRSGGYESVLKHISDPQQVAQIKEAFYSTHDSLDYILVARCPEHPEFEGLRVPQIAEKLGLDEFSAAMEIIRLTKDTCTACFFTMCEEDVETVIAHPRVMICTDSGVIANNSSYHPRLRASFPRAIARYVREKGVVSLPEMIRKMTSMPAAVYGFQSKGLIREGMDADICIFDPERLQDKATFTQPHLHAQGFDYVIVGGKVAAENAEFTGELGGTMLYRTL